jgi:flagellar biosynthesis/type III secretory pathway M-ring protein FliF/YscJ
MSNHNVLIVVAVVVCAVIVLLLVMRQQRSKKLRRRFGPEYEHAVEEYGSATKAEDSLRAREKRVSALNIHSLPSADRLRFADQWHETPP